MNGATGNQQIRRVLIDFAIKSNKPVQIAAMELCSTAVQFDKRGSDAAAGQILKLRISERSYQHSWHRYIQEAISYDQTASSCNPMYPEDCSCFNQILTQCGGDMQYHSCVQKASKVAGKTDSVNC